MLRLAMLWLTMLRDWHFHGNSNCQLPFIVLLTKKTIFCFHFPFTANKWNFAVSIFRLQKTYPEVTIFRLVAQQKWRRKEIVLEI
jgi:hypothetical protein